MRAAARTAILLLAVTSGCSDDGTGPDERSAGWTVVAAGESHACGLRAERAYCWGMPTVGDEDVLGPDDAVLTPVPVETDLRFVDLDAGGRHTCALTPEGSMFCWGRNRFGQLGNGLTAETAVPTAVAGGLAFQAMSLGSLHTCALTGAGEAWCWGGGAVAGKDLAVGHQPDETCVGSSYFSSRCTKTPRRVNGGLSFARISAGLFHTCGVDPGGSAHCWGWNFGVLGNGETGAEGEPRGYDTPRPVSGDHAFTELSAGSLHTCGLTQDGEALCWGGQGFNLGQLGTGRFDVEPEPAPVAGTLVLETIEATRENDIYAAGTCAVAADGTPYCWGSDAEGELGTDVSIQECTVGESRIACSSIPRPVDGGLRFEDVTTGLHFACGVTPDGEAFCWGLNDVGQLGDGTTVSSTTPVRVVDPG